MVTENYDEDFEQLGETEEGVPTGASYSIKDEKIIENYNEFSEMFFDEHRYNKNDEKVFFKLNKLSFKISKINFVSPLSGEYFNKSNFSSSDLKIDIFTMI